MAITIADAALQTIATSLSLAWGWVILGVAWIVGVALWNYRKHLNKDILQVGLTATVCAVVVTGIVVATKSTKSPVSAAPETLSATTAKPETTRLLAPIPIPESERPRRNKPAAAADVQVSQQTIRPQPPPSQKQEPPPTFMSQLSSIDSLRAFWDEGRRLEGYWKAERETSLAAHYRQYAVEVTGWLGSVDAFLLRHHRKDLSANWQRYTGKNFEMFDPKAPSWQMLDQTIESGLTMLESWFRDARFYMD